MIQPSVQALWDKLKTDAATLKQDPSNIPLRTRILKNNVTALSVQLDVTNKEAGNVLKAHTAAYATSQKIDPKALIESLTVEEQNILNYSKTNPKLYGLELTTANKLAGYLGLGSGVLLTAAIITFTIALFTVGPEIAAGIGAAEGVVGTIGAALGSPLIATGGFLFLLSQFLGHLSSGIPMMTKQLIDNGSIGPGLRISAITQAEETKAKLSGSSSPGSFTGSQFSDYAASLESAGVYQINDPCKATVVPYDRDALADLVKCIYGKAALTGGKTTVTKLIPQLAPYLKTGKSTTSVAQVTGKSTTSSSASVKALQISLNAKGAGLVVDGIMGPKTQAAVAKYGGTVVSVTPAGSSAPAATSTIVPAKVVSGIISNGTLGTTVDFTARQDDLIENADELTDAMHNNIAPFLTTLAGRVTYEVKIVSSIKLADGSTQKGSVQKIINGYTTKGVPKYKSVTNKFATVDLKIKTATGSFAKLATIVLGPVDSVKFQAANVNLSGVAGTVQQNIIAPVTDVVPQTTSPDLFTAKEPSDYTIQDIVAQGYTIDQAYRIIGGPNHNNGSNYAAYYGSLDKAAEVFGFVKDTTRATEPMTLQYVMSLGYPEEESRYIIGGSDPYIDPKSPLYGTKPPAPDSEVPPAQTIAPLDTPPTAGPSPAPIAAPIKFSTLFAYYQAKGQSLPSVSARAAIYQQMGLGQSAYYTGTAEQNTKLLNALQG